MSIVEDLKSGLDDILGVRDEIGAALKPVYIVTRTWSGEEPGDGTATDTVEQMLPSPAIVEFIDEYRIREGGAIQQGDIMLKAISKQSYPTKSDVDCSSSQRNIQKFYRVGSEFYQVIMVKEKLVTWQVQLRKLSNQ